VTAVLKSLVLQTASVLQVTPSVAATVLAAYAALSLGTVLRLSLLAYERPEQRAARLASLRTWWILALACTLVVAVGRSAVAVLFAVASGLGFREYLALTAERRRDRVADFIAQAAIPVQYVWIALGYERLAWLFLPLGVGLLLPVRLVLTGATTGFVNDVSSLYWGLMLTGYFLSHTVMLVQLPPEANAIGSWAGWWLYLLLLTESNDIAQALWGRTLGRHKITPTVSPHKTWEGLVGGALTTVALSAVLAPLLTPFARMPATVPFQWAIVAGLLVAIGGFLGDVTMSAVKRDLGVKDSSHLLPGQGGMLDRIDSLTFTAPLMYYYVVVLTSAR
jgi:phosphatidate cytidylyltransferase